MIDFARIVGFDWDEGNARKSKDKHGVAQREAEQVFIDPRLLIAEDIKHSATEPRYHALGQTLAGRLLHVTFTLRHGDALIRVISAGNANRKERKSYEKKT
jgi:uncharacterized DUF497 family protein